MQLNGGYDIKVRFASVCCRLLFIWQMFETGRETDVNCLGLELTLWISFRAIVYKRRQ